MAPSKIGGTAGQDGDTADRDGGNTVDGRGSADGSRVCAMWQRFDQRLLFAFFFFLLFSSTNGVKEGYEKVFCHPDYFNSTTVFDYQVKDLNGNIAPMNNHRGKLLLIVNTATY